MGYETNFSLKYKVYGKQTCEHEIIADAKYCHVCGIPLDAKSAIRQLVSYLENTDNYYLQDFTEWESCTGKWYDHETDMKQLSLEFPHILFTLSGDGEEKEDLWRKYFLAGKMQVAEAIIVYDNFSEDKLK